MLSWNALYGNFNSGEIEQFDIFRHYGFVEDCKKASRKFKNDRDAFEKEIRQSLRYYFWSKCEWEVIVSHWPPSSSSRFRDAKIDVFDQVMMNWDVFVEYVWSNRNELAKLSK